MTGHVTASRIVDAPADVVFAAVTDPARLPDWNTAITGVVQHPQRLEVGAEWVVEMHALGRSWHSRSVVETLDPGAGCFAYRSVTDDGNPSQALWTWVVADHPQGALVTVAGELHPRTFWRRALFVHIRSHQLRRSELPSSLAALGAATRQPPDGLVRSDTGDPHDPEHQR
jgi:uncharacterized protein YndB with AHSA1/START domain